MDQLHWWQKGVIYEVYVPSFMDANGDGYGDLPGITSRLDYLQWLGVDAIWLTPIYPSPMVDMGYDVADYTAVSPTCGTLEEFDELVAESRRRGIRVILDFVPNHTSDQHPWFVRSRSSRDDPRRDWYIWRDPGPGGPPNNWLDILGESAWSLDERTGQYFLHSYFKEQPDLNWRHADVRRTVLEAMRFWLDRGIAGFRLDAIAHLVKDERFRDNPPNPAYDPATEVPSHRQVATYSSDVPGVFDAIRGIRELIDEYGDHILIGESYLPLTRLVAYYHAGLSFPFLFHLIEEPFRASVLRRAIDTVEGLLGGGQWPNWVLGNHDQPRNASRIGEDKARVAAMMQLTLRGTPILYYGEEIGMGDAQIPPARIRDPRGRRTQRHGRDPQRAPMQWNSTAHAGFTTGDPWLPACESHSERNVAGQRDDPRSLLTLYHRLLTLRRAEPALHGGDYAPVDAPDEAVVYTREREGKQFLIALNVYGQPTDLDLSDRFQDGHLMLSTRLDRDGEPFHGRLFLRGDEGVLIELRR